MAKINKACILGITTLAACMLSLGIAHKAHARFVTLDVTDLILIQNQTGQSSSDLYLDAAIDGVSFRTSTIMDVFKGRTYHPDMLGLNPWILTAFVPNNVVNIPIGLTLHDDRAAGHPFITTLIDINPQTGRPLNLTYTCCSLQRFVSVGNPPGDLAAIGFNIFTTSTPIAEASSVSLVILGLLGMGIRTVRWRHQAGGWGLRRRSAHNVIRPA